MRRCRSSSIVRLAPIVAAIVWGMNVAPPSVIAQVSTTQPIRTDFDPSRLVADQVSALARQMTDAAVDQDARDSAARRLLEIGSAEARNAVQFALRDPGNNAGRLAAARAVGDDSPADTDFVDPLFVLMDADTPKPLLDAAAVALGNYKALPDVATRLVALTAPTRAEPVRLAAVRALSTQIEKRAAQRLVELAQDASAPAVAAAALSGLQTFASLAYDAPGDWSIWWKSQADLTDDRFRLDVLTARATRFEQQARRGEETYQELRRSVLATLAGTPREQRGDVLAKYLTSPREVVRLIAVRQAYEYAATADLSPTTRPVVRAMLADVSADVRYEAARIIDVVDDSEAFPVIAQQISIEPEARVRAMMAEALGKIGNVAALPLLEPLLDDQSTLVVQSAAGALANLGDALATADPREAAKLSSTLQRVLEDRGNVLGGKVRESILSAVVPLRQARLTKMFANMLTRDPPEPPEIRALAAKGLGAIGDPDTDSPLVEALSDLSADVRVEAVRALGKVSKTFVNAPRLLRMLDPKAEPELKVRNEAWGVIRDRLAVAPLDQLVAWPDLDLLRRDDAKRLEIFTALAKGFAATGKTAEQTDSLQSVGDTQLKLAESADDAVAAKKYFADATTSYQSALALARQTGQAMRVVSLTTATVHSMLRGKDYVAAAAFVRTLTPPERENVGSVFKREAEDLARDNKVDDATNLIREATAMGSALPQANRDQLNEILKALQHKVGEKNQYAEPDLLRSVCMR